MNIAQTLLQSYSAGFGYERDFIALETNLKALATQMSPPSFMRKSLKLGCEVTARCSFWAVPTTSSAVETRVRASLS